MNQTRAQMLESFKARKSKHIDDKLSKSSRDDLWIDNGNIHSKNIKSKNTNANISVLVAKSLNTAQDGNMKKINHKPVLMALKSPAVARDVDKKNRQFVPSSDTTATESSLPFKFSDLTSETTILSKCTSGSLNRNTLQSQNGQELEILQSEEASEKIALQIELETRNREVASLRILSLNLQQQLVELRSELATRIIAHESLQNEAEVARNNSILQNSKHQEERIQFTVIMHDKEHLIEELDKVVQRLTVELESLNMQPKSYADMWIDQIRIEDLDKCVREKDKSIKVVTEENEKLKLKSAELEECLEQLENMENKQEKDFEKIQALEELVTCLEIKVIGDHKEYVTQSLTYSENVEALEQTLMENQLFFKGLKLAEDKALESEVELKDCYELISLLTKTNGRLETDLMEYEVLSEDYITVSIASGVAKDKYDSKIAEITKALGETLQENENLHACLKKTSHDFISQTENLTEEAACKLLLFANSVKSQQVYLSKLNSYSRKTWLLESYRNSSLRKFN